MVVLEVTQEGVGVGEECVWVKDLNFGVGKREHATRVVGFRERGG